MLDYVFRAQKLGWAVLVANPHVNDADGVGRWPLCGIASSQGRGLPQPGCSVATEPMLETRSLAWSIWLASRRFVLQGFR